MSGKNKRYGKRLIAWLLASVLFFSGVPDMGIAFAAQRENEQKTDVLRVVLSTSMAIYTGGNLMPEVIDVWNDDKNVTSKAKIIWKRGSQNGLSQLVDAGTYTCIVSCWDEGMEKTLLGSADFEIRPKKLSETMIGNISEQVYDGKEKRPVIMTDSERKEAMVENLDYTISYSDNIKASQQALATILGKGNYEGKLEKKFSIEPRPVSDSDVSLSKSVGAYTGKEQKIEVNAVFSSYEITYYKKSVSEANRVEAVIDTGAYKVRVKSTDSNYSGFVDLDYSIIPKDISSKDVEVIFDKSTPLIYNGKIQKPAVKVIKDGERSLPETDYTVEYSEGDYISRGTYTVTIKGKGNYQGERSIVFVIQTGTTELDEKDIILEGKGYKPGYYRSSVKVRIEGYKLSENETDDASYQASLTFENSLVKDKQLYLKADRTGEVYGPLVLSASSFTIIKKSPVVDATVIEEQDEWTKAKTVKISEPEQGINYYYTDIKQELSEVDSDDDIQGMTAVSKSGEFKITTSVADMSDTYYIYAVDQAGNVSVKQIDVKNIDAIAPIVSVINENNTHYDETKKVFWKNKEDLKVEISVSDEVPSSGIESVQVSPLNTAEVSEDFRTVVFQKEGEYTIIVRDYAGNEAYASVKVWEDQESPAVNVKEPSEDKNGNKLNVHKDGEDIWWINQVSMRLPFEIENTGEEGRISNISVEYSTDQGENWKRLLDEEIQAGYKIFEGINEEAKEYLFRISDQAGNVGDAKILVAADTSQPKIDVVDFVQAGETGWINQEALAQNDGKVQIKVTAEEEGKSSGVAEVAYVLSQDPNKTSEDYKDSEFIKAQELDINKNEFLFSTKEAFGTEQYPDGIYYWIFRVFDYVGNYTEYSVCSKIDTVQPDKDAYARFISDARGVVDTSEVQQEGDSWVGKIRKFVSDKWDQICGRKQVQFELYLKDVTSGIKEVVLSYQADDEVKTLSVSGGSLKVIEGLKAFEEEEFSAEDVCENDKGYTVITGSITVDEKQDLAVSDFQLLSVTDVAENVREGYILHKGGHIVYLDTVRPKLMSVTVDDDVHVHSDGPFYFRESKKVKLEVDERFFDEAVIHGAAPVFTINRRTSQSHCFEYDEELTKQANSQTWSTVKDVTKAEQYLNSVEIELPVVPDKDVEYQFTMEFKDPSGNVLDNGENMSGVTEGTYISQIFVVSERKPVFSRYEVTGVTDRQIGDIPVYHMGAEGAVDIILGFTIEDNSEYWEKENVQLEIYKKSQEEDILIQTLNGNALDWSDIGNEHRGTYAFQGGDEPAEYYVAVAFTNKFGNEMEVMENEGAVSGKFCGSPFILDHEAPVFAVGYNAAYRLVKDGSGNTAAANDKEFTTPETGYTAYYQDNIQVSFTIDEDFAVSSGKEITKDFMLEIIKDGEKLAEAPQIDWSLAGSVYTGNFTLKEEGTYEIRIRYRDAAGNKMVAGREVSGSRTEASVSADGEYVSTVLVIDRTAPKITTAYVDKNGKILNPSSNVDSRLYFNDEVYLHIEVEDKNVRYSEFKDALLNTEGSLEVFDILGNAVEGDAVTEFLNRAEFAPDTVDHDGVVWDIPLFLADNETYGANYTITLRYEDLAGNGREGTKTDNEVTVYPTFDDCMAQQDAYICFTSDVVGSNSQDTELTEGTEKGWVSKIIDFVSDKWLKIFGKERLEFKIYLRDRVSGVDSVAMSYTGDQSQEVVFGTKNKLRSADAKVKITASEKERKGKDILPGYMVLDGAITVPENQDVSVEQFRIVETTDLAMNARSKDDTDNEFVLHNIMGEKDLIYLDRVAPVLNIDYGNGVIDEESRIFYKDPATLTYYLTERFFEVNTDNGRNDGNPMEPVVTIRGENQDKTTVSKWKAVKGEKYHATATADFPILSNREAEYTYTVAYQDAAGNPMEAGESCKGSAKDGTYTGYKIILDNEAPKLVDFQVLGDTDREIDDVKIYHNNKEPQENNVTITFTVDDNASYWDPGALTFEIYNESKGNEEPCVSVSGEELSWTMDKHDERKHRTSYEFDGEDETPATYYVKIHYADRAGNLMVSGNPSLEISQFEEGTYTSRKLGLDHENPIFTISYNDAYRVVDDNLEKIKDSDNKKPQTGYTSYYNDRIEAEITLTDHYMVSNDGELTNQEGDDVVVSIVKDGVPMKNQYMPEVVWTRKIKNGVSLYKARFVLERDGRYRISVEGRDAAMNKMVAGDIVQGSSSSEPVKEGDTYGVYTSTLLVLDTHAPVVNFKYVETASKAEVKPRNTCVNTGRNYFDKTVYLQIIVDDTVGDAAQSGNVRYQELKKALLLVATDAAGSSVRDTKTQTAVRAIQETRSEKGKFVIELPMSDEANYDLSLEGFEDLAGNKVGSMLTRACVDKTQPEAELSYKLSKRSGFSEALKYGKKDIWFANNTLLVTASVKDMTAGVKEIIFTVSDTDKDGKVLNRTKTFNPPDVLNGKTEQIFTVPIPLETKDFDGTVTAKVTDWSNQTYQVGHASIVESKKTHRSTGKAEIITKTSPSRVVGGVDYYNTDVEVTFSMEDGYSGLRSYLITPGRDAAVKHDFSAGKIKGIKYRHQKNVTLSSRNNNQNNVDVTAEYTDNTNHTISVKQQYNIDITAPVIEVEYNLNNPASERYYKDTRVATVTVIERNFSESDVEFAITNSQGTQPAISGWSQSGSGDATRNTCTVTYSADGDYTFNVTCQDKAGNRASYGRVDEFTIDQTIPTYTITYDNSESENECYYKKGRMATIDIEEHNFDPAGINVEVKRNGAAITVQLSGWTTSGDHNVATVPFKEDGEYTFTVSGMDLAQNELEPYPGDHFVIDTTVPALEIQNIEDRSANNGTVAPRILYKDINYDAARTSIVYMGYNNGKVDYSANGTVSRTAQGAVIQMDDVEHLQENDDIYTMKVVVYDKAGNKSEAEKIFSVNRFGSVYTFEDAETKALVGNGLSYTNEARDIRVKETNVDTLEFRKITCNHDGELVPMEEGLQYSVKQSGSETTWKQYTYTLYRESFVEDGRYTIKILSEDRAENVSDNDTKGKKMEFVMDTVLPSILVSGVESHGRYETDSQDVVVDVEDNVLLKRVQMYVNNQLVADYDDVKELNEMNGVLHCAIEEQNYSQDFTVVAVDAAGNEYRTEMTGITVNTKWWRLFLANKPLLYGSVAALVLLLAFGWILFLAKRKKREEEGI